MFEFWIKNEPTGRELNIFQINSKCSQVATFAKLSLKRSSINMEDAKALLSKFMMFHDVQLFQQKFEY